MIDNFDHLVTRCEAMRRRRMIRISFMIVGTLLFVIAGISGYKMWLDAHTPPPPIVKKELPKASENVNTTLSLETQEVNQTEANITEILTPVTVQNIVKPADSLPIKSAVTPVSAPAAQTQPKPVQTPIPAAAVVNVPTAPATAPTPAVKSKRLFEVNTQTFENPVDAYQSNPKYETALAAARDFYAQENYVDSAIWAKKANQLNREAEEAWLLYAKTYYAHGRKKVANAILELYLNYKDSNAASELIRTWK
jgi:hypothetical protein